MKKRTVVLCFDFFLEAIKGSSELLDFRKFYINSGNSDYFSAKRTLSYCSDNAIPYTQDYPEKSDFERLISEHGIDTVISAGYSRKIPIVPGVRMINIHPSLLPKGRGPWPIPHFLLGRADACGVAIHEMTDDFDAGDILVVSPVDVTNEDTYDTVCVKLQIIAVPLLRGLIENFDQFWEKKIPQKRFEYFPFPSQWRTTIDWKRGVAEILKLIRAFGRTEVPAVIGKDAIYISEAKGWIESHQRPVGSFLLGNQNNIIIYVRDGIIVITGYRNA